MILRTAIQNRVDAKLPNAVIWNHSRRNKEYIFKCNCGNSFTLRDTNQFTTWEDIRCADCKRLARIKPYIGERYVFRRIKWDASKAGRSFNLSFDWFVKAIHLPCHYCNRRDINSVTVASKRPGEVLLADFRYNGLDRVDNSIGYEEDNCVPCCVVCNRAKNSMGYADFMEYIQALVQHNSGDSNVNNEHAVHSARIPYRGRHRKSGNVAMFKELQESNLQVPVTLIWTDIYGVLRSEVAKRDYLTNPPVEGVVQA